MFPLPAGWIDFAPSKSLPKVCYDKDDNDGPISSQKCYFTKKFNGVVVFRATEGALLTLSTDYLKERKKN